jgi:hypothetical protein
MGHQVMRFYVQRSRYIVKDMELHSMVPSLDIRNGSARNANRLG